MAMEVQKEKERMMAFKARTGRHHQRYVKGCRLVAGCIPFKYTDESEESIEVLMVTPHRGDGLLFPKGGWEDDESMEEAACREALEEVGVEGYIKEFLGSWEFRSRRNRDEHCSEGSRKGFMFALLVNKELDSWPEKDVRQRRWVTVTEAKGFLRHEWMRKALEKCVDKLSSPSSESVDGSESPASLSQVSDEEPSEQSACDDDAPGSLSQLFYEEPSEQSAFDDNVPDSLLQLSDEEPLEQSACDDDTTSCLTEESSSSLLSD